jgi:hypothetical protein
MLTFNMPAIYEVIRTVFREVTFMRWYYFFIFFIFLFVGFFEFVVECRQKVDTKTMIEL